MKVPKTKIVFDFKHKSNATTPGTVSIQVYEPCTRKRKWISTGVMVLPCHWSEEHHMVYGCEDAHILNKQIREQLDKCNEAIRMAIENDEFEMPSTERMKADNSRNTWLEFMHDAIMAAKIKPNTRKQHLVTFDCLMEWGRMKRFEQVTRANIQAFVDHLESKTTTHYVDGKMVAAHIKPQTIHGYYKRLAIYVRKAQAKELVSANALKGLVVPNGESEEREYLTDEEIERWKDVELPTEYLCAARDRFIVQMSCGMSYDDFIHFDFKRHEDVDGRIILTGKRGKSGKPYFIVMLPYGVEVLERWKWQVPPISNVNYNEYLLMVAKYADIPKHITSHVARHTYACYCLRHGVRMEAVSQTLGHTKLSTTQIYARLSGIDVLNAFKQAFDTKDGDS